MRLVLLVGVLSFFADFTYEGARSVLGPWLATMGASATIIGMVVGFGELLGYGQGHSQSAAGRDACQRRKAHRRIWPGLRDSRASAANTCGSRLFKIDAPAIKVTSLFVTLRVRQREVASARRIRCV